VPDARTSLGEVMLDKFRTGKAYSLTEAAHLAETTPATVRRWLMGYEVTGHRMTPVFGSKKEAQPGEPILVSFLELIEIVVVAGFRRGANTGKEISLERLRRAHAFARSEFGLPYPFASLDLREAGGHVMHKFDLQNPDGPRLALDLHGQWELPGMVRLTLENFDFDRDLRHRDPFALRWFPRGRGIPIVVDPHVGAGRPTILGRGVTLGTIQQRWKHGESITALADDYETDASLIEKALQYAA